jgi:hypothetical protein
MKNGVRRRPDIPDATPPEPRDPAIWCGWARWRPRFCWRGRRRAASRCGDRSGGACAGAQTARSGVRVGGALVIGVEILRNRPRPVGARVRALRGGSLLSEPDIEARRVGRGVFPVRSMVARLRLPSRSRHRARSVQAGSTHTRLRWDLRWLRWSFHCWRGTMYSLRAADGSPLKCAGRGRRVVWAVSVALWAGFF